MRRETRTIEMDFFEVPRPANPCPGSHDYRTQVSEIVSKMLADSPDDRYAIAASMSRLLGRDVSKYMLDAYSAPGREEYNLPFYLVAALEVACHSHALTLWLTDVRGGRLLIGKEALNAELGRLQKQRDDAAVRMRELKKMMGEPE